MTTKKEIERIFEHLGIEPRLSTFNERIKLQKLVYLLEYAFDIDLGLSFSWYLHGPYSPDLTRIMFDKEPGIPSKMKNNLNETKKLENAKIFLKDEIESVHKLELLASLHFFIKVSKGEEKSIDRLLGIFEELKPQFNTGEIKKYYKKIEPYI